MAVTAPNSAPHKKISTEDLLFMGAAGIALYSFMTGKSSLTTTTPASSGTTTTATATQIPNTPPIAAPGAPISLTQTGATTSSITLTWQQVEGAVEYQVWQYNPETMLAQVTSNTAEIQNLQANSHYELFVIAIGSTGLTSQPSQPVMVSTASTAQIPTVPSLPGGFTVTGVSATSVTFKWLSTAGATEYQIQNNTTGQVSAPIVGLQATISGLEPNTPYQFSLLACNSVGCSNPSSLIQATTSGQSGAPSTTGAPSTPSGLSQSGYTLSWSAVSGATSYRLVNPSTGQVYASGITGTSVNWGSIFVIPVTSGSQSQTIAVVAVEACNATGCSAPSSPITITLGQTATGPTSPLPPVSGNVPTALQGVITFLSNGVASVSPSATPAQRRQALIYYRAVSIPGLTPAQVALLQSLCRQYSGAIVGVLPDGVLVLNPLSNEAVTVLRVTGSIPHGSGNEFPGVSIPTQRPAYMAYLQQEAVKGALKGLTANGTAIL